MTSAMFPFHSSCGQMKRPANMASTGDSTPGPQWGPTAPAWAKVTKLLAISYFLHPIKNLSKNPDKLKGIDDIICKCSTNTLSAFLSQLL